MSQVQNVVDITNKRDIDTFSGGWVSMSKILNVRIHILFKFVYIYITKFTYYIYVIICKIIIYIIFIYIIGERKNWIEY